MNKSVFMKKGESFSLCMSVHWMCRGLLCHTPTKSGTHRHNAHSAHAQDTLRRELIRNFAAWVKGWVDGSMPILHKDGSISFSIITDTPLRDAKSTILSQHEWMLKLPSPPKKSCVGSTWFSSNRAAESDIKFGIISHFNTFATKNGSTWTMKHCALHIKTHFRYRQPCLCVFLGLARSLHHPSCPWAEFSWSNFAWDGSVELTCMQWQPKMFLAVAPNLRQTVVFDSFDVIFCSPIELDFAKVLKRSKMLDTSWWEAMTYKNYMRLITSHKAHTNQRDAWQQPTCKAAKPIVHEFIFPKLRFWAQSTRTYLAPNEQNKQTECSKKQAQTSYLPEFLPSHFEALSLLRLKFPGKIERKTAPK